MEARFTPGKADKAMGNDVKISGGTFIGNTIGGTVYTEPLDFVRAQAILSKLKSTLADDSDEFKAISELETKAKTHSQDSFLQTLKSAAVQFSSATLANLAGSYLGQFL